MCICLVLRTAGLPRIELSRTSSAFSLRQPAFNCADTAEASVHSRVPKAQLLIVISGVRDLVLMVQESGQEHRSVSRLPALLQSRATYITEKTRLSAHL